MRFRNTAPHALDFKLAGTRYQVPVGGDVDLPDKFTEAVKSRKTPLEPIPGTEGTKAEAKRPSDEAPPPGTPARLWYDRAHQIMAALDGLQAQQAAALDAQSEERAETQAKIEELQAALDEAALFPVKIRERIGIGAGDSILEAIDAHRSELAKLRADLDAATKPAASNKPRHQPA